MRCELEANTVVSVGPTATVPIPANALMVNAAIKTRQIKWRVYFILEICEVESVSVDADSVGRGGSAFHEVINRLRGNDWNTIGNAAAEVLRERGGTSARSS